VRRGWIPRTTSRVERLDALLRFFRIGSPQEWEGTLRAPRMGTSFRQSRAFRTNRFALSAWIRQGEIEAMTVRCGRFDQRKFQDSLGTARKLIASPTVGLDARLRRLFAGSGVAVVFVPLVRGVHAWGATRWLPGGRAMALFSLRGRYEDIFWFSFFHEAAHLLLHGKKDVFVEEEESQRGRDEEQADAWARDFLIPPAAWQGFVAERATFPVADIRGLAAVTGVSPAIVVGRLQHEGRIARSHMNDLRRRIELAAPTGG
jgi:HTH-type transcriptional regulator / antitoxin HigA